MARPIIPKEFKEAAMTIVLIVLGAIMFLLVLLRDEMKWNKLYKMIENGQCKCEKPFRPSNVEFDSDSPGDG